MSSDSKLSIEYIGLLQGHTGPVTCLACGGTPEQPILYSGSRDKSIIQWSLSLENKKKIEVEVKNDEKADDKQEKQYDYLVGIPKRALKGHNHFVSSIALSSKCEKLISGSWDKTVRIWDLNTLKTEKILKGHTKDVLAVSFSTDDRMIFTGSMDKSLKFWNLNGELKYDEQKRMFGWVSTLCNINKGKDHYLAVGSWDSNVRIYNKDYSNFREIKENGYAVTSMCVSNEGDYLFVAHKDGTIYVYNLAEDENHQDTCRQTIETNVDVNSILFDSTYFNVYAIGTAQGLQIREIKGGILYEYKVGPLASCNALCYDPSKNYLFAGFNDGTIRVYQIKKQ